jgi:hypothetical protein
LEFIEGVGGGAAKRASVGLVPRVGRIAPEALTDLLALAWRALDAPDRQMLVVSHG